MKECVNCGMPIPTSARVCPYCKTDQPKHYSSETFCYVISGIVLIVAFILGGVKGPSKKEIQSTLNNELIQETVDLMDIYEEVETYSYSNVYNNTTEKGDIELHNLEQKSITDELSKTELYDESNLKQEGSQSENDIGDMKVEDVNSVEIDSVPRKNIRKEKREKRKEERQILKQSKQTDRQK